MTGEGRRPAAAPADRDFPNPGPRHLHKGHPPRPRARLPRRRRDVSSRVWHNPSGRVVAKYLYDTVPVRSETPTQSALAWRSTTTWARSTRAIATEGSRAKLLNQRA